MKLSTGKLTSAPFISLKTTPLKEIGEAWLWMSSCSRRHPSCLHKTHLFNKYSATSGIKCVLVSSTHIIEKLKNWQGFILVIWYRVLLKFRGTKLLQIVISAQYSRILFKRMLGMNRHD